VIAAAVDLYRAVSPAAWAHAGIRWASCPLGRVAEVLPARGRILDLGCGQGLLSLHLALGSAAREVVGVDIDGDRLAIARKAADRAGLGVERARFLPWSPGAGAPPAGPWDAILIVDVLYLMPRGAQRQLLAACAAALAPGGVLLVKEMASDPGWKFRWNLMQETLAVRVLRFTRSAAAPAGGRSALTFVAPDTVGGWLAEQGLRVEQRPLHRGYLHPHHLLLGRRAGAGEAA
jgi:2-polyprenyl-3-methyl-5-hydroxy-6-metoxy-1,4-benzoquinol methylase